MTDVNIYGNKYDSFYTFGCCLNAEQPRFSARQKSEHGPCHDFCIILCAKSSNGKKGNDFWMGHYCRLAVFLSKYAIVTI